MGSYLQFASANTAPSPISSPSTKRTSASTWDLTPETHVEAIKRIGAHFRKLGLKTKMLLGDATGPRDTHKFVLQAAIDPEALQYVGAVGFHSWGGGTPEQYRAWGDVAEWLQLPLLVTELGVDAAAYYTALLRQLSIRPSRSADDTGTADVRTAAGHAVLAVHQRLRAWPGHRATAPSSRQPASGSMKQFTDLTPHASDALGTTSDQKSVLFTASAKATHTRCTS